MITIEVELLTMVKGNHGIDRLQADIIAQKPDESYATRHWTIYSRIDPLSVQRRLQEGSLGDLVLKTGDSLSAVPSNDLQPDLGLAVDDTTIAAAGVRAWENAPMVQLRLDYHNQQATATQTLSVLAVEGHETSFLRDVYSPNYAEMGYDGHNSQARFARDTDEVEMFVQIARDVFEH